MAGYENTKFGNGTGTNPGATVTNVHNFFGPRVSGGTVGPEKVTGSIEQLVIHIEGGLLNDNLEPLTPTYLPQGATIRDVYWDTEVVFTLTGTTPTILIGTDTTEVTNGLVISQAVAQSANTARLTGTLVGTWAVNTPLQARTKIGYALGGTSPTVDRLGRGKLTIEFWRPNNDKNY